MPYNTDERGYLAKAMTGCGALYAALDEIGNQGHSDHDLAKVVVDNEMALRALLTYALNHLAAEH